MNKFFPFFVGSISTCLSMCLRRYFHNIVFNPLDLLLMPLVLLSLITIYQWLSFRKVKMPTSFFHLILYFLTILVVVIVRDWGFRLIAVGAITSSGMMMDASGPRGDDHSSSSFFEGLSGWIRGTAEPGEERNSQPSQGVGQRLPGSPLEISSPGISGESLFRDSVEQPGGGPAPSEAAPPANPAGSQEAGPSNQGPAPYPYQPDQVIGGDSVRAIQRRLLSRHEGNFTYEVCYFTRIEAEDLFEVKAKILGEMSRLDPEGPWLERGARALDNPRTSTGEESLERLFAILDALREGGRQSEASAKLIAKL